MGPLFISRARLECVEDMDRDALIEMLEPPVGALGYELVEVMYRPGQGNGLLRLYIDAKDGVTVEDCEKVSHQVSGLLEVEDPIKGHYTLEVSSPGADRPLRTEAHFQRFTGARVKVELVTPREGRRL